MQAVQALTGRGGWPMTVFLTPDGVPFYGGTYFPPEDRQACPASRACCAPSPTRYKEKRGDVDHAGQNLLQAIAAPTAPAGRRRRC